MKRRSSNRSFLSRTLQTSALVFATALAAAALPVPLSAQIIGPYPSQHIYPSVDASPANIRAALVEARRTGKRVILDFGGDWCPDCQVLNIYFSQEPNRKLLDKYFIRVNVNIGHEDANVDTAHRYGVPLTGVPALAVLDSHGKLLHAQTKGISNMRSLQPSDVTAFLNQWKP